MPELPEVETVRRSLLPRLRGRRVVGVDVREKRLRAPVDPRRLRRVAVGRRVEDITRRAKYLILRLEGERRLLVHLGMTGRLLVLPSSVPPGTHEHVCFRLDGNLDLRYRDHRRFGLVDALPSRNWWGDRRLAGLGREPLAPECDGAYLHAISRGVRKPVKNFLMDARVVVGVGNIYASESLFLAGVHPRRAAGRIGRASWERLASCLKRVLEEAILRGGTTLLDFQDAGGESGWFQLDLAVYDRAGEYCRRCGAIVRRIVLAGRSTFYCGGCQR